MSDDLRFSPPPRSVPGSLAIASLFNGFAQIAWGVFGLGMIFFWVFPMNADLSFISVRGPLAEAAGEVVRVEETAFSEGRRNAKPIYANHYVYFVADRPLTGVSYSVGVRAEPGQRVTVEYPEANPARSRIAGMRRAPFGRWALALAVFPLAGLVMLVVASGNGWRRTRLLGHGHLAPGKLVRKRPTNAKVNGRVVHELTFEFTGRDGRRHEMTARTSAPERLEDEKREPLLYDPARPSRAYLLDRAPSRPRFGTTGELLGAPRPALRLLVPALVVAVHGWLLLSYLR
jgi:Protein of unknown function (DUF3592)